MVDAWAADTVAGHDTLMLAWRRASVADLNRLARVRAEQLGWLTGPDLVTPDGRGYAAGDPVVTLAPNHRGELVTSQRGRVVAIDQRAQTLTMVTDDGRRVALAGAEIAKDHLDHGYALTVHREQGATADRTHYLAEGGGRELAYVAMSRARGPSIVHAVADNLDQAIEDITHDWSSDRSQRWVTRTAQPGIDPTIGVLPADPNAKRARLVTELAALDRLGPPSVRADLIAARRELDRIRRDRQDLDRGTGRWVRTPAGRASGQLGRVRQERRAAEDHARMAVGRRERHHWRRLAQVAAAAEARAQQAWTTHVGPVADRLDRGIVMAEHRVADLEGQRAFRGRWLAEHPQLARRVEHARRELQRADDPTRTELLDRLDAINRDDAPVTTQSLEHTDIAKVRERLDKHQRARTMEPLALSL